VSDNERENMNWKDALQKAQQKLADDGADRKAIDALDNKRQRIKFAKGFGCVRELAGLTHTRVYRVTD
jgi:hypothetical protein